MSRITSLKIKAKLLQKQKKKSGIAIKLKEAYHILAKASGYSSWQAMKSHLEEHEMFESIANNHLSSYPKKWHSSYEEAKASLKDGEFLIPYGHQYFICGAYDIQMLGIFLDDSDLVLVGDDWSAPKNPEAGKRLFKKLSHKLKQGN